MVQCEKIGDWDVKLNKEKFEQDPATVKCKSVRFNLIGIAGTHYSIWDNNIKEIFVIKGEKHFEKWTLENKNNWCTDF